MEIKIECPWCNQHYSVDESYVGQKVECSVCEKEFVVSKPSDSLPQNNKNTQDYFSDYFSKEDKANSSNGPLNQKQEKQTFILKRITPKVIVAFSALVIVLIVLSVAYYTKVIPDKQYRNGLKAYAEKRYDESLEFFQKASEHGHKQATAEVNFVLGKRATSEHRYEDALKFYLKAEELGHTEAQKEHQKALAEINFTKGEAAFKEQRFDAASQYYMKAEELGHTKAKLRQADTQQEQQKILSQTNLKSAKKAIDEHRFEEAVKLLQQPASQGNSEAQFLLGTCYYNGEGIKRDEDEAARWFRKAAEQGDMDAQYKLGLCYLSGTGVAYREDEAIYWLQKAAEQGHPKAQLTLGDLYYKEGVNHNFSKALEYYKKAGEFGRVSRGDEIAICLAYSAVFAKAYDGDPQSQYLIYELYHEGKDNIAKNDQEALKWLQKSASSGYPKAEFDLSEVYKLGKYGVSKNEAEEIKWLKKAAEHGNDSAQIVMGINHLGGFYNFEKSRTEARKWLRKAAIQDEPSNRSMVRFFILGSYLDEDINIDSIPKEELYNAGREQIVKKYRKPAEKGDVEAMLMMGDCYLLGFGVQQDFQKALDWYRKCGITQ